MNSQQAVKCIDDVLNSDYHYDESLGYQLTSDDFEWLEKAREALLIVDKLEQNGAIVPPYKVGTTIYRNIVGEDDPQAYKVIGFYCEDKPKIVYSTFQYNGKTYDHRYYIEDEGIYYHLSAEEAKSAKRDY